MQYAIWFETVDLYRRIGPMLAALPGLFRFDTIKIGTPEHTAYTGGDWDGFPMPNESRTAFVFEHDIASQYAGGALGIVGGSRAAVRALPQDADEAIFLRLWHELLHTLDLDADGMKQRILQWLPLPLLPTFVLYGLAGRVDTPHWHRQYYQWVTEQAVREDV